MQVISLLLKAGIDGTLMQLGMAKQTKKLFDALANPPAMIIAMDYRHYWKIPGYNEGVLDSFQSVSVEQAMDVGCTAVKVMIPYGDDDKPCEDSDPGGKGGGSFSYTGNGGTLSLGKMPGRICKKPRCCGKRLQDRH